ncbi:protein phosphatase 2C domain-containing protein [Pseudonocardia eucalypti]|uniref:Protein phosphatase 2C domain-containing protein n=2 Tax=Pseudonocardia eucalypti TaxID=648755 RepID=A0ABP9Q009_9PSEU
MVTFYAPKAGNAEHEWEDGAATDPGDPLAGRNPRFAVADGATEGFGSARWAAALTAGFLGNGAERPPPLSHGPLGEWLVRAQERWNRDPALAGANELARLKAARVGSFATFLGCELTGLAGPSPGWHAIGLGDTVLFQVRGRRLVTQAPPIPPDGFGVNPDGISTKPERLAATLDRLEYHSGRLAEGDRLYLATDALAQWLAGAAHSGAHSGGHGGGHGRGSPWPALAALEHPATFRALVTELRRTGAMVNDDVTLLRVHLAAGPPRHLVVCG